MTVPYRENAAAGPETPKDPGVWRMWAWAAVWVAAIVSPALRSWHGAAAFITAFAMAAAPLAGVRLWKRYRHRSMTPPGPRAQPLTGFGVMLVLVLFGLAVVYAMPLLLP